MNIKYITCRCNCQSGRPIKFVYSYLNHLTVKILMITWTCISEARVMSRKKTTTKNKKKKQQKTKKHGFRGKIRKHKITINAAWEKHFIKPCSQTWLLNIHEGKRIISFVPPVILYTVEQRSFIRNVLSDMGAQRRFSSDCAFAQSDLNLPRDHFG